MKRKHVLQILFWLFVTGVMFQSGTAQAANVYRVNRYGELTYYSGSPSVTIRSDTSAIYDHAFDGVRTTRFSVSSGNPYFKTIGGVLYSKDGTLLLRCPTEKTGSVTVPSTVKKISAGAFKDCSKLSRVFIPDSVNVIGAGCFEDCSALRSVRISGRLEKLPDDCFEGCSSMTGIVIPASVREIGDSAFDRCQSLKSVSLPDSVKSFGSRVFAECVGLTTVRVSKNMDTIGSRSFQNCTSLKTVSNTGGIEDIGNRAFYNCVNLKTMNFSDKLDRIGWQAFRNCVALGTVLIPRKTERIDKDAFMGAASRFIVDGSNPNYASSNGMLMSESKETLIQAPVMEKGNLIIPNGTKRITANALVNGQYSSISLPEGITEIYKRQFKNCDKLKTIYLPASLMNIRGSGYDSYDLGLNSLEKISVPKSNTAYQSLDGAVYTADGKAMVFYPYGRKGSLRLPDACKKIGGQMRENKLSSISVSSKNKYFTSVHGVLYDLRGKKIKCFPMNKKTYKIPKTLKSIDYLYRVKEDMKCKAIQVASSNKTFYSKGGVVFEKGSHTLAFYPTKKKGSYKVPVSTRYIDSHAFEEAHYITALTITKNVGRSGGTTYYFDKCRNLQKIDVKQGELNYISMSFSGCNKLKSISFPSNIMTTDLWGLPEGVTIRGWQNTQAKESAERAKGKFVSLGTIPPVITGGRVKKIIDKYQLSWNASRGASGYQIYTVSNTIADLKGSGSTTCFIKDIYEYDTIYIRAYRIVKGKKVYGKAKAVSI